MRTWTSFRGITPSSVRERYSDDPFNYNRRRLFGDSSITGNDLTIPSANISTVTEDTKTGYLIELAVPGYEKGDFDVKLDDDTLSISAENSVRREEGESDDRYSSREFNYHVFSRSFRLPEEVDEDAIVATYRNGILGVFVPVAEPEEAPEPRRINVS
jgi:HSP20 family protein